MNFGHVLFIQIYFVNFWSYFMSFSPVMNKSKKHLIYSGSKDFMKDKLCLMFLSYLTISTPVTIVIVLEISSFLTEISSFLPKNLLKNNEFSPQKPSNLLIFEL